MSKISELEQFLAPLIEQERMELVDLQYATEGGQKVLRIFLDKEDGVKLTDCEIMSNKIGELLDTSDIIPDSYVLEVSSPGLDRILKKESDFVKFAGKKARVSTYAPVDGQRNFLGKIVSCADGRLTIDDETGKTVALELQSIARARLESEV
jgi:ribosome maturation factor RimP